MIYVDPLSNCLKNKKWRYNQVSHMWSDKSDQELIDFATSIGLKKEWFQKNKQLNHFDLNDGMRDKVIRYGATPLSRKESVDMWQKLRKSNQQTKE